MCSGPESAEASKLAKQGAHEGTCNSDGVKDVCFSSSGQLTSAQQSIEQSVVKQASENDKQRKTVTSYLFAELEELEEREHEMREENMMTISNADTQHASSRYSLLMLHALWFRSIRIYQT